MKYGKTTLTFNIPGMKKSINLISCCIIAFGFLFQGCDNDPDYENYIFPASETKSELNSLVDECTGLLAKAVVGSDKGQYLQHFFTNFQNAVRSARNILENEKATQAMVDAAVTKLSADKNFFLSSVNEERVDSNDEYLVLHLRFNGNITDSSPVGHLPELNQGNSVSGNGPRPSFTTDRLGRGSMAMHFENGGYISIPYAEQKAATLNPEVMTFMCWVKESNPPAPAQRWLFCLDTWNIYYVVLPAGGSEFQFGGQTNRGWLNLMNAGFTSSSEWIHFVVTYSPDAVKFYRNGELMSTYAGNGGNLVRAGAQKPFLIGIMDPERELYYNGDLDEFRLYNKVLTASEVMSVYNIEKPGNN